MTGVLVMPISGVRSVDSVSTAGTDVTAPAPGGR